MTTRLDKDTRIILKLDLGEKGVRRIPLSKLWDESRSAVSYALLVKLALGFNNIDVDVDVDVDVAPRSILPDGVVLSTTYIDEDGDEITISSDEELADAFGQFVDSVPPVVRAKAVVIKSKPNANAHAGANATAVNNTGAAKLQSTPESICHEARRRQQRSIHAANLRAKRAARIARNLNPGVATAGSAPAATVPPVVELPPVNVPPVSSPRKVNASSNVNSPSVNVNLNTNANASATASSTRNTSNTTRNKTNPHDTSNLDPNFIHGRHTCDGCLSTPIYGIRYHATNVPDYDLCSNCHSNYQGTDIVFQPMQLDRDRHLQARWQRRHLRRCRPMMAMGSKSSRGLGSRGQGQTQSQSQSQACPGTTRKVIDGMDDALKEAIRRSLVDFKSEVDKKKEKKQEPKGSSTVVPVVPVVPKAEEVKVAEVVSTDDTTAVAAKEDTKVDEEEDIHVAPAPTPTPVIDISAGNDDTQRALDNMDPRVKKAISRSLNDFFVRRQNQDQNQTKVNESGVNAGAQFNLSPDEQTQEKIDAMDDHMKEAIRRSLNDFFASRRATKENKGVAVDPPASNVDVESGGNDGDDDDDNMQRTQELLDAMNPEMRDKISRSLGDFFARRVNKNEVEGVEGGDGSTGIQSVVVDIVVDDDDDDLSEGTIESDSDVVDTNSNISEAETKDDNLTGTGSSNSDGGSKDEWQMVTEDDEMIAMAAQMLGSALFQSDSSIDRSA